MNVTRKTVLWWNPKDPNQANLFESWIELGEDFFESITSSPVPVRYPAALKALNHSALALDLYGWATHKTYSVSRRRESQFISFQGPAGLNSGAIRPTARTSKRNSSSP